MLIFTGAPFYPAGIRPKASCPFCVQEKGDRKLKDLYGIYGFGLDQHDSDLPNGLFVVPPRRLSEDTPDMAAIRVRSLQWLVGA
jgi:hypothetical protein